MQQINPDKPGIVVEREGKTVAKYLNTAMDEMDVVDGDIHFVASDEIGDVEIEDDIPEFP